MPSASGIKAGQAYVELFVSDNLLARGLRAAQQRLEAFAAAVKQIGVQMLTLGLGIAGPILAATKQFVSFGDQLDKMSKRTGISVEALSELAVAAESSGTSLEAVETAVRGMQRTLTAAARGSASATAAFHTLDLSVDRLAGLNPEQQFLAIAEALTRITDPTQRAAAAMKVLGRSGTALLPLLNDLPALREEAHRLGLTLSTEQASAAADLSDAFDRVRASVRITSAVIGSAVAPALKAVAERIVGFLIGLREWIAHNQALVVSLLTLGALIVGVGAGLIGFSIVAKVAAFVVGGLSIAVSALGTVLGLIGAALGALVTPAGALIGALLVLGATAVAVSQSSGSALSDLGQQFGLLRDDALGAVQGIADALAAGDIGLAAKILWLTLKLEWQRGVAVLKSIWIDATTALALSLAQSWFGLQTIWAEVVGALSRIWTEFTSSIAKAWNITEGFLAKSMAKLAGLFDKSFDVAGVTQQIDQEITQKNTGIDQQAQQQQVAGEQRIAGLQSDRETVLKDLGSQNVSDQAVVVDELSQARQEFQQALTEAQAKRTAIDERVHPSGTPPPLTLPNLDALSASLDAASKKVDVTGTFNASALGEMGVGGSASERTAKATEDTARNTSKILREVTDNELAFE